MLPARLREIANGQTLAQDLARTYLNEAADKIEELERELAGENLALSVLDDDHQTGTDPTIQTDLVTIGYRMVSAHSETATRDGAIDICLEEYPEVLREVLALIWIGINCKDIYK